MIDRKRGFTLLEVIVVVGILAVLAALLLPRLGGRNHQIKAEVRKIAVLSRDIRNNAKLQNATYRLVIEMNPQDGEKRQDTYWVEKAPGNVMGEQYAEEMERLEDLDEDERPPDMFQPDPRLMKKPATLPDGMFFNRVELSSTNEAFSEGRAYIYYLPQGFVDESVIHISYGEQLKWTVAIRPLTGKADIVNKHVGLVELRQ